jgi:hypothetical protein
VFVVEDCKIEMHNIQAVEAVIVFWQRPEFAIDPQRPVDPCVGDYGQTVTVSSVSRTLLSSVARTENPTYPQLLDIPILDYRVVGLIAPLKVHALDYLCQLYTSCVAQHNNSKAKTTDHS